MIIIRNAIKEDISIIGKFNSAMAIETENKPLDSVTVHKGVKELLKKRELGFYLISESDGVLVGQFMVTKEWSDRRNREFWWIQSVYVHPDFPINNVFQKLYTEVIKSAKESGKVCGIRLYVDKNNTIAQKVYSKLGMAESNYMLFEEDWSDV